MAHTTTCPACGTNFRVTAEQLLARQGNVRCGRCNKVFNAHDSLTLDYPPPPPLQEPDPAPVAEILAPLDAPSMSSSSEDVASCDEPESPEPLTSEPEIQPEREVAVEFDMPVADEHVVVEYPPEHGSLVIEEFQFPTEPPEELAPPAPASLPDEPISEIAVPLRAVPEAVPELVEPIEEIVALPAEPQAPVQDIDPELERLAAQFHAEALSALAHHHEQERVETPEVQAPPAQPAAPAVESGAEMPPSVETSPAVPKKRIPGWLTGGASLGLALLLILQSAIFFRTDLLAYKPSARPLLEQLCGWLGCRLALPQNPDLLSIETSALEADPGRAGRIALSAVLRNRASFVQAYPHFELTLTDYQDKLIARRIFQPQEYLPRDAVLKDGMPANEEIDVKLHLDIGELQAAGYRVYLFYSATTS